MGFAYAYGLAERQHLQCISEMAFEEPDMLIINFDVGNVFVIQQSRLQKNYAYYTSFKRLIAQTKVSLHYKGARRDLLFNKCS